MSVGDFINKAKSLVSGHPDQARQALSRVEQVINNKTGGKYASQVSKGGDMLEDRLGVPRDQQSSRTQGQTRTGTPSDDDMQGGSSGAANSSQSPGPGLG